MRKQSGFTLVEIMIVVAIIGLLAAIAIPAFMKARNSARRNACINNLRQIDGAKDTYALEYGGTNGSQFSWANLSMYIKDYSNKCTCPASLAVNRSPTNYNINPLGTDPDCNVSPGASNSPDHSLVYKAGV